MRFLFTYSLQGEGANEEAALADALEAFLLDPGEPDESKNVTESWCHDHCADYCHEPECNRECEHTCRQKR